MKRKRRPVSRLPDFAFAYPGYLLSQGDDNERITLSVFHLLVRLQRRETPAVIGQKLLDTLDALSAADPLFTPWNVPDEPTCRAHDLAEIVIARTGDGATAMNPP